MNAECKSNATQHYCSFIQPIGSYNHDALDVHAHAWKRFCLFRVLIGFPLFSHLCGSNGIPLQQQFTNCSLDFLFESFADSCLYAHAIDHHKCFLFASSGTLHAERVALSMYFDGSTQAYPGV